MYLFNGKDAPKYALMFRTLALIIGLGSLVLQILINIYVKERFMVNHSWAFFTIQTNIIVILFFLFLVIKTMVSFFKTKELKVAKVNTVIHLGVTFYATFTMIVYWLTLAPGVGVGFVPLTILNNLILHLFMPLFIICDCIFYMQHGVTEKKAVLYWLIYPAIYLIMIIINAQLINEPFYTIKVGGENIPLMYPYSFLDPQVMSIGGSVISIMLLTLIFTALGLLFLFLDTRINKKIIRHNAKKLANN